MALLKAFRVEQTEPARFYSALAEDSVNLLAPYTSFAQQTVLDVGAGRPEFAAAFTSRGATYVATDADVDALGPLRGTPIVAASGDALPFHDAAIDVCFCSNVFEHVSRPETAGF